MIGPVSVGSIGGTRILVGLSWLVLLPVVALGMFLGIDPAAGSVGARVAVAAVGSLLVPVSVVVHELGHTSFARRRGISADRIVVFLLGGYSEIDLAPASPADRWLVAAAGPVASVSVGGVFAALAVVAPASAGAAHTLRLLAAINTGVAAFNLLPALPLDGGRMLRAGLERRGRSSRKAERMTAWFGALVGVALVAGGVVLSLAGSGATLVLVPLGLIVMALAAAELHHPRPAAAVEKT